MKFFLSWLLIIISVTIVIYVYVTGSEIAFWGAVACGVLILVAGGILYGILWIVKEVKYSKEYERVNKEYDQYETEAEQALASEIDTVKGNSLKKELVKRRLVREYIEKNHPQASRRVNDSKFEDLFDWLYSLLCSGWVLVSPLVLIVVLLLLEPLTYMITSSPYNIPARYYVVANAVFAIVAVATTIWKRYYILALVAATIASISVFGIFTVGPDNILQPAYRMMIECVDCNFLNIHELAKATMCYSFLLVTLLVFCLMTYPFIKNWAIGLWLSVFIIWVCLPIDMSFIIWKLYMIRSAIVADIAVMLGMSYAATHMLLFVYMLSLLPVLSALPAFFRAWRACRQQDEKTRTNKQYTEKCERVFRKCMIWLIINIVAMALLWSRFIGFSLSDAQMILEDDCEKIANFTGIYYKLVYLIVLIVPPLLSIIGSRKLYNYTKKQIK